MYDLFPGIPCSVVCYRTVRWHDATYYFFPSVDNGHTPKQHRLSRIGGGSGGTNHPPPATAVWSVTFSGYSWNDHDPANGKRMMNNVGTWLSFGGAGDQTMGNGTKPDQILKLVGYPKRMGDIDLGVYANYGRPISNVASIRLSYQGDGQDATNFAFKNKPCSLNAYGCGKDNRLIGYNASEYYVLNKIIIGLSRTNNSKKK